MPHATNYNLLLMNAMTKKPFFLKIVQTKAVKCNGSGCQKCIKLKFEKFKNTVEGILAFHQNGHDKMKTIT